MHVIPHPRRIRAPRRVRGAGTVAVILVVSAAAVGAFAPVGANATCNVIPSAARSFRAALGSVDRPFAGPGSWLRIRLDETCHGNAGFTGGSADQVVTIVFTPPAGPRSVVVTAADCRALDLSACTADDAIARIRCVEVNGTSAGIGLELVDERTLQFLFPDTDVDVLQPTDDRTLAGPATIAVTGRGEPVPCALATHPCAAVPGLRACVDALFAGNGSCDTTPGTAFSHFTALPPANDYQALCTEPAPPCQPAANREVRFTVDAAGNLLLPMDWRGVRVDNSSVPVPRKLRASTVVESFVGSGLPIRGLGASERELLASYTPQGVRLDPIFDLQLDPSETGLLTLFGTTDASESVLRIARHPIAPSQCVGGSRAGVPCADGTDCDGGQCLAPRCVLGPAAGAPCATDADCPASECGPGLFDFSQRFSAAGVGPVIVSGTAFEAAALDPVPLDGLVRTQTVNAFVMEESIAGADLNGDCDARDHVVTLANRATGTATMIGERDFPGRAVARIQRAPFSFPAVAAEADVIAFLEPEPSQGCSVSAPSGGACSCPGTQDTNGDGDVSDAILRVFRLGTGEIAAGLLRAVDAAPVIDGRSLAVSAGHVFFRSVEAAGTVQSTRRVSVTADGSELDAQSRAPTLSADGRVVGFCRHAPGIDTEPPAQPVGDLLVHDRDADGDGVFDVPGNLTTEVASVSTGGAVGTGSCDAPRLSADGRLVAFQSTSANLVGNDGNQKADVFVRDRSAGTTARISVDASGGDANQDSFRPDLSADGRFVAFGSLAGDLVAADGNGAADVFVRDRDQDGDGVLDELGATATTRVSTSAGGLAGNGRSSAARLAAGGRFVVFDSLASNLVGGDGNARDDVFGRDRDADGDGIFDEAAAVTVTSLSRDAAGEPGNLASADPDVSQDGRFVAFESDASNLVAGDTNGMPDIFIRDRDADGNGVLDDPGGSSVARVSVDSGGAQANEESLLPHLSADGRFVVFQSYADNLVRDDTNAALDVFVHDRLTRQTTRVSLTASGTEALGAGDRLGETAISRDGDIVAFQSAAANLVAADANDLTDVFVRGPDSSDASQDLFADDRLDDTVLEVLDAATGVVTTLCPAGAVAVAAGKAAFLRPESTDGSATCPGGSLNGDLDPEDRVVQLWTGAGPPVNLGVAATAIAMSSKIVAALVSESSQGGTHLNGDLDALDQVVQVHPVGAGAWTNVERAGEALAVSGALVAFISPEQAGGADLNGDHDPDDRVLQLFDAERGTLVPTVAHAVEEFVLGPTGVLAFRRARTETTDPRVLEVYDPVSDRVLSTGQVVTPCRLEACDPQFPYRVLDDTVVFLTLECEQAGPVVAGCPSGGRDLDGDGDAGDLVVQLFNVRRGSLVSRGARQAATGAAATVPTELTTLAAASAGVCTDTGAACATDEGCPAGSCFVPPGGCIRDLGTPCDPDPNGGVACPTEQFCDPLLLSCQRVEGPCGSDADCGAGAHCNTNGQGFQRLVNPLLARDGGAAIFAGAGRCVEDFGTPCGPGAACPRGRFCERGSCRRERDPCAATADCPPPSTAASTMECRADLVTRVMADRDGDELPDDADNCPDVANVLQEDADADGAGDACDAAVCGNGVTEAGELCDDGGTLPGNGCDAACRKETCVGDGKACGKCQRTIAAQSAKLAQLRTRALGACELGKLRGRLAADTVCAAEPRTVKTLAKATTSLAAKIGKACGGADQQCGTGDDAFDVQRDLGFPAQCPSAAGSACQMAIGSCANVVGCLTCIGGTAVEQALPRLDPSDPKAQRGLNKCQRVVAAATGKLLGTQLKALRKCWDARAAGKHERPCPDPAAPKRHPARTAGQHLLGAEAKMRAAICKACGGADKRCGGAVDLTPAEIGFPATCPLVPRIDGGSCFGPLGTLGELTGCLACVATSNAACLERAQVPQLAEYPPSCAR